jgi:hypothetical protein
MLEKIKKIFKKKPKVKAKAKPKKVEEVLVLDEDKTFENEVKKPEIKEKPKDTKETKSSLTFGE